MRGVEEVPLCQDDPHRCNDLQKEVTEYVDFIKVLE